MTNDIRTLLTKPWETVVTSGGILFFESGFVGSNTVFGCLRIQVGTEWISMCAIEIPYGEDIGEYDFLIEISESIFPLDPKEAVMNNPRLQPVTQFPDNCRLDYLRDFGVADVIYDKHPKSFTRYYEDTNYDLLLKSDLQIISKNGYLFTFTPSDVTLGSIEISMQPLENDIAKP